MLSFPMFWSPHTSPPAPTSAPHNYKFPRPTISPTTLLESTLPIPLTSIHSKPLTATRFPLESTLTKKPRGRGQLSLTRSPTRKSVLTSVARKDLSSHATTERPSGATNISPRATTEGSEPAGRRVYPHDHRAVSLLHQSQITIHQSRCRLTKPDASFNVRSLSDT